MSRVKGVANQIAMLRSFTGKKGKHMSNAPMPRQPAKIEMEYVSYLRKITKAMKIYTSGLLDSYLPRIKASYSEETRRDSWVDDLESFRIELTNGFGNILEAGKVEQEVKRVADAADRFSFNEFRIMSQSVFGVDVFTNEPWKDNLLRSWSNDNVALIKNVSTQTAEDINQIVQRGIKDGMRNQYIKNQILMDTDLNMKNSGQNLITASTMRKMRNRADLIAVDQVGKINGQLNRNRQEDLGVKGYGWRNVGDERVRGNPVGLYKNSKYDHWHREGEGFTWKKPPPDGHPGIPIRCRCSAQANLTELISEIETIEKGR